MEEPSGEGKGLRSRTVIVLFLKEGRVVRARAVERPKAPEPRMRIENGGEGGGIDCDDGLDIQLRRGAVRWEESGKRLGVNP